MRWKPSLANISPFPLMRSRKSISESSWESENGSTEFCLMSAKIVLESEIYCKALELWSTILKNPKVQWLSRKCAGWTQRDCLSLVIVASTFGHMVTKTSFSRLRMKIRSVLEVRRLTVNSKQVFDFIVLLCVPLTKDGWCSKITELTNGTSSKHLTPDGNKRQQQPYRGHYKVRDHQTGYHWESGDTAHLLSRSWASPRSPGPCKCDTSWDRCGGEH